MLCNRCKTRSRHSTRDISHVLLSEVITTSTLLFFALDRALYDPHLYKTKNGVFFFFFSRNPTAFSPMHLDPFVFG